MIAKKYSFTNDWYTVQSKISTIDELMSYNNSDLREISFKYNSEILLITNSRRYNFSDLIYWFFYHKNILKFDNIVVVHNNNEDKDDQLILKQICDYFKVEYYYESVGSQSLIFNKYQKLSRAKWMICIDEDEFIYLPNDITINQLLYNYADEYKLTLDMINFYSNELMEEKNDKTFLENFNYICLDELNNDLIFQNETDTLAFTMYKTFVNNSLFHYILNSPDTYLNRTYFNIKNENNNLNVMIEPENKILVSLYCKNEIGIIHNPLTMFNANMVRSFNLTSQEYVKYSYDTKKPNISVLNNPFIAHYKYRTLEEYKNKVKYNKFADVNDTYYNTNYRLDKFCNLYKHKLFSKVDKLYKMYLKHINEWNVVKKSIKW